MPTITVTIKDGKFTLDFDGFQGTSCYEKRAEILKALEARGMSVKVTDEKKKPEAEATVYASNEVLNQDRV